MIKIAPSILASNFAELGEEIKKVDKAGADMIHLDIMDGHFVPNISFGANIVKSIRKYTEKPFDVHLMIENVDTYIPEFVKAGANRISIHVEGNYHIHRSLMLIKSLNCECGVVLNPATPVSAIDSILNIVDFVLVMSVNPGFGGQSFIENVLPKIQEIRTKNQNIEIQVDGGINEKTAKLCIKAGATNLVAGTSIFGTNDYKKAINSLKQ